MKISSSVVAFLFLRLVLYVGADALKVACSMMRWRLAMSYVVVVEDGIWVRYWYCIVA